MAQQRKQVAVIGGGVAGLTCAYRLAQTGGIDVRVLESAGAVGGVIQTRRDDGYVKELAANGMLSNASDGALDLCRELEIPVSEVTRAASRRWVYMDGRLRALPASPPQLAGTDMLSWRAKLRLLAEPLSPRAPQGTEESVADFVRRRLGDEVLRAFVAPLVTGIYAGDVEKLSLRAAFPKLAALEDRGGIALGLAMKMVDAARNPGSGTAPGPGRLWSPDDGMAAIPAALSQRLGDAIETGVDVSAVERSADAVVVVFADGRRSSFDAAVLAVPAPAAANIVAGTSPELSGVLSQIEYAPIAIVHLGVARSRVRHALDGFGFLVSEGEDLRLLGCVFESVLWKDRAGDGRVLLRCILGGTRDRGALDLDDEQLVAAACDDLRSVIGLEGQPEHAGVARWPRAVAQYNLGHLDRVERAESLAEPLGLALTGSSYRGVSVNDCIANARIAASAVARRLGVAIATAACLSLLAACSGGSTSVSSPRDGGDAAVTAPTSPDTPDGAAAPYKVGRLDSAGTVFVKVEWPQPPTKYVASAGRNACGADQRPPLSVHTLGGLRSSLVWISGIEAGRAPDPPAPAQLAVSDCRLDPPVVQVARLGGELLVANRDERRHDLLVEHLGGGASDPEQIARLPLRLVGQHYKVPTERPGIVRVTSKVDPADHAYAFVPRHPYAGVTNDKGEVTLEQVPAGTYTIEAWHRPLAVGGEALTASASITVEPGKKAKATLSVAR